MPTTYLLDANFFIQSYRVGFPMDVVPSFWIKLKELSYSKVIISIDKVKNEIYANDDDLTRWCKDNLPDFFFKDSSSAITSYSLVVQWANSKLNDPYSQQAIDTFMESTEADAWLVAFAHINHMCLVTNEVSAITSKKSVKIPDVCNPFGVRSISPMDLFRELGVKI